MPNCKSKPFENEEVLEAYKTALRAAFEANHLLLEFAQQAMSAGEPITPLAAIQAAVAEAKLAESAWLLFARLSAPEQTSASHEIGGMKH